MTVRLMMIFLVIFSFSVLGRNLVSKIPIIITANGCTPCVVKEINATGAMVPAKVEKTLLKELRSSLIKFSPTIFGPLLHRQ